MTALLARGFVAVALSTAIAGLASADVVTDQAAAILNFPYVTTDVGRGIDTILEISNTDPTGPVTIRCYWENANSHCSNAPQSICNSANDCPDTAECTPGWSLMEFRLRLTRRQPISWRASQGRSTLPCDGVNVVCGPDTNAGSIPPVPEDPFRGLLLCVAIDDATDQPVDRNVIKGEATFERYDPNAPAFDVAKSNAIGIQAIAGANDGDPTLVLGGAAAEYNACPNTDILNHFFDGAPDPAALGGQVFTTLVLVPCGQDLFLPAPAPTSVQYLVFNEFEQRFSTATDLRGQQVRRISSIDTPDPSGSIFGYAVSGTLTGQTRISSFLGSGALAMAIEEHVDGNGKVSSAAFNAHMQGQRSAADYIGQLPAVCQDGLVETGEECDLGADVAGDCCAADCTFEPSVTKCPDVTISGGIGVGRPGGIACVPAVLAANAYVQTTRNDLGFSAAGFTVGSCKINPTLGNSLTQSALDSGATRIDVGSCSFFAPELPNGQLYACPVNIDAGTAPGNYDVSNLSSATNPHCHGISGVGGNAGHITVTTCTGDCNGNGMVSIGEVTKCVNMFLGAPPCDFQDASRSCPVADANNDGTVSVGEVVQCINRFLSGC